ncbi:MAG: hypothetical protein KBB62_00625 [Candidatus Pacebacteria bacterium]|nr:hypothetical protein [Candidatus Paceibacterota bacterium]
MKTSLLYFVKILFRRDSPQLCYVIFPFIVSSISLAIAGFIWTDLINLYLETTLKFIVVDIIIATIIGFTLWSLENK